MYDVLGTTDALGANAGGLSAFQKAINDAVLILSPARKLRDAYTGPLIRVIRSSDNAEQDIGTVGGLLDTATLSAFIGSGDGLIATLYDQSSNARHHSVAAALANRPRIVIGGVLQTLNGKPALNHSDNRGLRNMTSVSLRASLTALMSPTTTWGIYNTVLDSTVSSSRSGGLLRIGGSDFIAAFPEAVKRNNVSLVSPFNCAPINVPFLVEIRHILARRTHPGTTIGSYDSGSLGGMGWRGDTVAYNDDSGDIPPIVYDNFAAFWLP